MTGTLSHRRRKPFRILDFGHSCLFGISGFEFRILLLALLLGWLPEEFAHAGSPSLDEAFRRPPQSAGVRCFWWWLNGNVTKEAITRDLQEMKAKGFSGALIFDAGGAEQRGNRQVPAGPMFTTPAWRELFVHAVREADRLGLELSLSIQSGWNLGGPMVTPEMAAKMLTWSEIQIQGPTAFHGQAPQPRAADGFYRDIALLAYRNRDAPNTSRQPIRDLSAKAASKELGSSAPDCRFLLTDVPATPGEEDCRVADILNLSDRMKPDGELAWDVPEGTWTILRFGYTTSPARVSTSSAGWEGRVIDYMDSDILRRYWDAVVAPLLTDIARSVPLKAYLPAEKTTPDGVTASSLKYLHTDSWECGGANWTEAFPLQFERRRKYSPLPYLPVIAGKIVESRDVSNRFLADFRKTLGDCIAENHYATFAELAHRHGLGIHPESGGPHAGPFDGLKCLSRSDIAMSEFWVPSPHRPTPPQRFFVKQAASVAHACGGQIVGAEAFTSIGPHWNDVLWASQKPSFDHEACSGLNLCFLHTFTCSPKEMGLPGQEYFAGTHINPNVTWWEMAGAFTTYLARCQYMLRQGRFVADVCHYAGDHVPNIMPLKEADPAGALPGYDYDFISEDVLTGLTAEDGQLVCPGGMRYRLLSLPDHKILSLAALEAVARLVRAGATVVGPKPERTATLTDYPRCDERLARLSEELWGDAPGQSGRRVVGEGQVVWGKTARQILMESRIPPDFEYTVQGEPATLDYIHRKIEDRDVYFVCNQSDRELETECLFRTTGSSPQLWNPVTGDFENPNRFTQIGGQMRVSISFAPYGSWFVVLSADSGIGTSEWQSFGPPFPRWAESQRIDGPWNVTFASPWGDTFSTIMTQLGDWAEHSDSRIRRHSGKATYECDFDLPAVGQGTPNRLMLDLGRVEDLGIARVVLNDQDLGILWTKPFRVEINAAAKTGANRLRVEVLNSWRNRLIGDRDLPAGQARTTTNITVGKDWKPAASGLLGPVTILRESPAGTQ
ncbi:MAG: glycoside hydrolase [Planctomycetes bacterium]|nr:glycoside hydrolase [Planctomycetota bacterium]